MGGTYAAGPFSVGSVSVSRNLVASSARRWVMDLSSTLGVGATAELPTSGTTELPTLPSLEEGVWGRNRMLRAEQQEQIQAMWERNVSISEIARHLRGPASGPSSVHYRDFVTPVGFILVPVPGISRSGFHLDGGRSTAYVDDSPWHSASSLHFRRVAGV